MMLYHKQAGKIQQGSLKMSVIISDHLKKNMNNHKFVKLGMNTEYPKHLEPKKKIGSS
jgi:hypothetical protein